MFLGFRNDCNQPFEAWNESIFRWLANVDYHWVHFCYMSSIHQPCAWRVSVFNICLHKMFLQLYHTSPELSFFVLRLRFCEIYEISWNSYRRSLFLKITIFNMSGIKCTLEYQKYNVIIKFFLLKFRVLGITSGFDFCLVFLVVGCIYRGLSGEVRLWCLVEMLILL